MDTPQPIRLAVEAMATRFEIVLVGDDPVRLRAAGEAALAAVTDTEAALSRFVASSFVARLNRTAPGVALRTDPLDREWLLVADELQRLTGGAFDLCHGTDGSLELDDPGATRVRRTSSTARVDAGSIGKGVALDRARDELVDAGVTRALIHGGTSTVVALGAPPERSGWGVRVDLGDGRCVDVELVDAALSVSAQRGQDRLPEGGHVVDARTGTRSRAHEVVACTAPRATLADAWTTALLASGAAPDLRASACARGVTVLVPGSD
ncbi:ApbE family protein [Planctomycetes bacterium Pla163]|uniref:FAD:protein FMN transferase n=1 Tax=Rohdeia mirabilis TaxID=2528008 RepID=A0A518CY86_9BACT|nr:ApbE family protein [Planctomycetes bacterium Pla163]